jgi:hypothetical protein
MGDQSAEAEIGIGLDLVVCYDSAIWKEIKFVEAIG